MKLIVGLGNPGRRYRNNRHNIGFMLVDAICKKYSISYSKQDKSFMQFRTKIGDSNIILLKPLTYMNLSGEVTSSVARYYKIATEDVIILLDDFALPLGNIRIRSKGSSGGHNGLKSIINCLGTDDFVRLRLGIGREGVINYNSNYVLSDFDKSEQGVLEEVIKKSLSAIETIISDSIDESMRKFN